MKGASSKQEYLKFLFHLDNEEFIEAKVNYIYHKVISIDENQARFNNAACNERVKKVVASLPHLKNSKNWTNDEQLNLIYLVNKYGCQWEEIQDFFPNRTAKSLKCHYIDHLMHLDNLKELLEDAKSMKELNEINKDPTLVLYP